MVPAVGESRSTTTAVLGSVVDNGGLVAPAPRSSTNRSIRRRFPAVQPDGTTTGGSTDAAEHRLTRRTRPGDVGIVFAAVSDDGFGRLTRLR
jgi:hypothetical protein